MKQSLTQGFGGFSRLISARSPSLTFRHKNGARHILKTFKNFQGSIFFSSETILLYFDCNCGFLVNNNQEKCDNLVLMPKSKQDHTIWIQLMIARHKNSRSIKNDKFII